MPGTGAALLARGLSGDDTLGVCFFVGAVVAVVVAAVALSNSHGKQLNDAFARFARQFRGTFRPGDWSEIPAVSFEHNTSQALLDVSRAGGRGPWCTQLTFAFRRPVALSIELDPDGVDKPQLRLLPMRPSPVGDPAFDLHHRVISSDPRAAADLFTAAIREDLMRVRDSLGNRVNICVSRDFLLVRCPGRLRDFSQLLVFAHVAFQVHDQLRLVVNQASPDEVRILEVAEPGAAPAPTLASARRGAGPVSSEGIDAGTAELSAAARCGVCGESVLEERVLCRCCRAPHHKDCWEYNRGCSVYACRERTYIRPAEGK